MWWFFVACVACVAWASSLAAAVRLEVAWPPCRLLVRLWVCVRVVAVGFSVAVGLSVSGVVPREGRTRRVEVVEVVGVVVVVVCAVGFAFWPF